MTHVFLTHDPSSRSLFYGGAALAQLRELAQVRLNPLDRRLSAAELIEAAQGCELLVSDVNTPVEAVVFDSLPELVAVLRGAVDRRSIDLAAASRNGVLVTHASPGFVNSVSELIFGMMIDLARHVTRDANLYHQGKMPAQSMGTQLSGATLGILGYGSIGRFVATLGQAFGMRVLVADPFVEVTEPDLEQTTMEQVLETSDFVVCLVVANAETENLMNAQAFSRMKTSAYFINASRGNLVDETALMHALTSGEIAGAGLDVGRAEGQAPTPSIAALPNVVATPHTGGLTPPAAQAQALETVVQIRALLGGEVPQNALNAPQASRLARLGI